MYHLVLFRLIRPRGLPQRGRGKARLVGRGGGRSQPAARGRGRGCRGRACFVICLKYDRVTVFHNTKISFTVAHFFIIPVCILFNILVITVLQDEINAMSRDEMVALLVQTVRINPGLMFNVMRPSVAPECGFHLPGDQQSPHLGSCVQCRDMPTPVERVCCGKRVCITHIPVVEIMKYKVLIQTDCLHKQELCYYMMNQY
ncbi:hypothetical protein DPMN_037624 [Dreissena polymorpha]|uniref:Uncharacterized protein n=1 Tax=Dreissena polymorpha TaxID=45954 RepID=A0A9D4RQ07_DREPO|nr:hypothetical protein DPMN_037624 [Dreissena polymorpha]